MRRDGGAKKPPGATRAADVTCWSSAAHVCAGGNRTASHPGCKADMSQSAPRVCGCGGRRWAALGRPHDLCGIGH